MDLRDRIEANRDLIMDRLDPDFGLLDVMITSGSLTRPEVAIVKAVQTTYGRSEKLLEYVLTRNIYEKFLDALRNTQQTHLANFILRNGERPSEDGADDWPLTKREISILDSNQQSFVDLLETCDLLRDLYSHKVINSRQRDFLSSKSTAHEKNDALLEILRRTSLQNYDKTINCLHSSKQSHIATVLKDGGVVVRARSELLETESSVDEVEDELITKFTEMFGDRSLEDSARIFECAQLRLIAAKKGHSVVLYFFCLASTEVVHLQKMQTSGQLANVVREEFNKILSRAEVIVLRTTIFDKDSLKICELGSPAINVSTETAPQFESCAIIVGFEDLMTITKDVIKINLHQSNEISTHEEIPTAMRKEAFASVYGDALYVSGIGDCMDEIWKYVSTSVWTKCASFVQGRRRHSAAFIDEVLYICGGFVDSDDGVSDCSVEAYNAVADTCEEVGYLVHCVKNAGNCVPFKSSLYIFGGLDKDYKALRDVQVYNTKHNTCTLLTKPMPRPDFLMPAVAWGTSVVFVAYDTCFIFNIETETWQERNQFKTGVLQFGLVLENGRVFVIGGGYIETDKDGKVNFKCRDDVRYVPLQNIIDDKPIKWKIHATLPKPSLVSAYGKMHM